MKQPLWTKDFLLFIGSNFFVILNFYLLATTMAMFAMDEFSASESEAGLAAGLFVIGAVVTRIFAGGIIEKIGRKRMLYTGLIFFVIATFLYFFSLSLPILFAVRLFHGLFFGLTATAINTTVMDSLPNDRRGEGTGYFSLSSTAATAFGPFVGILLYNQYGMKVIFEFAFVTTIIALIFALFAHVKEANISAEERKAIKFSFKFSNLFSVDVLPLAALTLVMGVCYASIVSFINIYATELDLVKVATYFFLIYGGFLFIARPVAGKLMDAKGDNVIIYPSMILFALSLYVLSITTTGTMLVLAAILAALGYGTYMSSAQAISAKVAPRQKIGLAVSTYYVGLDTGVGFGPFVLGFIIPLTGYNHMYAILAIVVVVMIGVYYLIHGRKPIAKK